MGDDHTLGDAFALSYKDLTPHSQRMLRFLSLHPGEHFDIHVAAALTGTRLDDAQRSLDELVDAHLVQEPLASRYRLHDLVRTYASELTETIDPEPDRVRGTQQLLDYYVHAAASACALIENRNGRQDFEHGEPLRPDLVNEHATRGTEWLEAERATMVALSHYAATHGHDRYAWLLAKATWRFFFLRGYIDDLVDTHRLGLAAAERLDDLGAAATMHNYLASAYFLLGHFDDAADHLRQTLAYRLRTADRMGEVIARRNLATVLGYGGHRDDANDECERALAAATRSNDASAVAHTLINASAVSLSLGQYDRALLYGRRALALARELGDEYWFGIALGNVGIARAKLGQVGPALRLLRAALRARRLAHDRYGEAEILNELGAIHRALGHLDEAVAYHQQALVIVREAGFRHEECVVYDEFGRTLLARGDTAAALDMHQRALARTMRRHH
jgi:tetratricopeptide (TPR) repeat protein